MPQRHQGKKSRLSAPEITLDSVESAASTSVIILSAADVINGHSGDYEGALDQLGRFYLRSNIKLVSNDRRNENKEILASVRETAGF